MADEAGRNGTGAIGAGAIGAGWIETGRLILRPPRLADVPALFAFLGDPQAMRWTRRDASPRDCRRRIAAHERRRRRDGYAPWTVVAKPDGRIIGWGGLYCDPFEPGWGPEVGYFLHPDAWGRGYASELVAVCIALADRALRLPELRGFAHPENIASRRVLEKAGFGFVRAVPEMNRLLFVRPRPGLPTLAAKDHLPAMGTTETFPVQKTDAEWRAALSPEAYRVLRRHGTERAFTSPLNAEKRPGLFACAGCGAALFRAETKFDSGTGWPSFFDVLPGAVGTREDRSFFMRRTEVHCARCGGHLGHVFPDGPPPTGLRYCMNGAALAFTPDGA